MPVNIQIKVTGADGTIKKLANLRGELSSFSPALRKTGEFLVEFYKDVPFATEGSIYGARWKTLKPSYSFWKAKNFFGRGILERSGFMRKQFVFVNSDTLLRVYNTAIYAQFHQRGTSRLPKRVIMQLTDRLGLKIIEIFKDGITKKIRKVF